MSQNQVKVEDAQTEGVKNWDSIKAINIKCEHKVVKLDPLTVAAKKDNCEIEIEHKDGSKQSHTVNRGGGYEKRNGYIIIFKDAVYKVD